MDLKINRRPIPSYISTVQFGVEKDLERIIGTYDGPEGNARVEIVRNPKTNEYYKLEISTNAPAGFYDVLRAYFGIDAHTNASTRTLGSTPDQQQLPGASPQNALPGNSSLVFERPPERKLLR